MGLAGTCHREKQTKYANGELNGIFYMSRENNTQKKISYTGLGLAIGLILGGIVGLAVNNMIIFVGGGLVLGLGIGSALDNRRLEDDS